MESLYGSIIFLIGGGGFIYAGFYILNLNLRIEKNGIKTKAKIVDFVIDKSKDMDGDAHVYHFPVVRFTDNNGVVTTQKLDSSANPNRINQTIEIIYLKKDDHYEIMINTDFWKTYFPLIFVIGGFVFAGIGIAGLINNI
ncbi:MAG: DUF3592 domain-containing protein [Bacteroidota bacterium]